MPWPLPGNRTQPGERPQPGASKPTPRADAHGSAASLKRRRWSGSGPDARDPAPLASTLQRWLGDAGAGADLTKATVLGRWAEIVGAEVADHCEPVSLVDGELLLRAESTAWATQLRMLAPQIVAKINREMGHGSVLRHPGPGAVRSRPGDSAHGTYPGGPRDTYLTADRVAWAEWAEWARLRLG